MEVIYIKDLVIVAKHGVHEREKDQVQRFKISVELSVDITRARHTDNLNDTLNWSTLRDIIIKTTQNKSYNLVERLAQEIADQLFKDGRIQKLTVSIDKLDAFTSGVPGIRLEAMNKTSQ